MMHSKHALIVISARSRSRVVFASLKPYPLLAAA